MSKSIKKIKVELDEDIVNEMIKRKTKVGDTYSSVLREVLKVK